VIKRDWADDLSDEFLDLIMDGEDAVELSQRIGKELRKAFLAGIAEVGTEVVLEYKGSKRRYCVSMHRSLVSKGMPRTPAYFQANGRFTYVGKVKEDDGTEPSG
jgi:hypothetical protein